MLGYFGSDTYWHGDPRTVLLPRFATLVGLRPDPQRGLPWIELSHLGPTLNRTLGY